MGLSTQVCFRIYYCSAMSAWTSVERLRKRLHGHVQKTQPDMHEDVCSEMRVSESTAHSPLWPVHQAGKVSPTTPQNGVIRRLALLRYSTGNASLRQ